MLKQTPSQTIGPFFKFGLVFEGGNNLVSDQTKGQRINIKGRVLDGDGAAMVDALVEIWQPDAQGIFNSPADPRHAQVDPHFRGFGRADTVQGAQYTFKTIKPGPIAWDDKQQQAPFINVRVFARGMLNSYITRLYFSDESSNQTDPVLNLIEDAERRKTLLAQLEPEPSGDLPTYRFDIAIQGDHETVFFEP